MTDIDLYLDPVCPFAWVTSRWLLGCAEAVGARVTLRQMSLAVLNEGEDVDADHRPMIERSRRLGRLFAAVTARDGQEGFARLYETIGTRIHVHGDDVTHDGLDGLLDDCGLDSGLSASLDDPAFDDAIANAHAVGQRSLGGRGGSPIVAVDGRGFFGPVLTEDPGPRRGVALLEAVVTMATTPGFAVLQRPFAGPPTIEKAGDRGVALSDGLRS
ncbi:MULTISPECIES: mycothiol-dependent nitroreductase Rv2466c family protein [Nocardia]|uniref:mycothiol-dependent nitroreductase Rv2466c family protein n=1 Tax=Nocardia TaxID=1817 RepID=UPI000D69C0B5|nr:MULTISPECIES: disulfide bond formation protein DsbA [Nocardia]